MAHDQGTSSGRHRLIAGGAVATLCVATALAFARVFRGPAATWKLIAAALAAVALAALLERRSLWLATLTSAALLLVAVGLMVFPRTTLYGLPTRDTLRAVTDAVGRVGVEARLRVAPALPLSPLLLAALTAVWTASFSAHALAIRAGSPLLALLPPAALLAFSDSVLEAEPRPGYGAIFLLGALAVLFVDGLRRVERWGPLSPWPGGRRLAATTTTGARRVATAVVVAAFLFPGLLPGYGKAGLMKLSTSVEGDEPVGIDPLVSIKADLDRDRPVELFRVAADHGSYWRMLSLDTFDGESWTSSDPQAEAGSVVLSGRDIDPSVSGSFKQEFIFTHDVLFSWIPMAYPVRSLNMSDPFRWDDQLETAVALESLREGTTYTAFSNPAVPTRKELRAIDLSAPAGPETEPYLRLPDDIPVEIDRIAENWTAGATTDFDRILAIQNKLRTFTYSTDVPARSDTDALVSFLTTDRIGFCQQFATAMAVLLRDLGYPARIAVGFTEGAYDEETRDWRVTTANAHSWVEVLFPSGWLAFEPTPQRSNPVANAYLNPAAYRCEQNPDLCKSGKNGGKNTNPVRLPPHRDLKGAGGRSGNFGAVPGAGAGSKSPGLPGAVLLKLVALAGLLLLVAIPPAKTIRRRWRLRRAGGTRASVAAAYGVFVERAADLGFPRGPGETPAEYRDRVAGLLGLPDGTLEPLTRAIVEAVYAQSGPSEEGVREARAAGLTAIREIRRRTPLVRQVMGIYRLGRAA